MPIVLLSFKKTASGHVMFHGFTAPNDKAAERDLEAHAAICPQFGPAHRAGETIEQEIDVDTLPQFTEESIADWVDELIGAGAEEEEEEAEGAEEEEEEE